MLSSSSPPASQQGHWRWLLLILAAAALLLGVQITVAPLQAPGGGVQVLDKAQVMLDTDGGSVYEGTVDLARRWDGDHPGQGGRATYRIALAPHAQAQPMALLFSRVGNQVEVRVNGGLIQHWGELGDPEFDAAKHPVMAALPAALLRADRPNELRVDVTIQPQRLGGLSVVLYGPRDEVEAIYDSNRRWRELAMLVFAVGLLGTGVFTGVLWVRQRLPMYGWFGLGALLGMMRIIERAWPDAPLPWPWLGALAAICYMAHMALMCRFSVLATGPAPRAVDRSIDIAIVASSVLAMASFATRKPMLLTLGLAVLVPMSLASLWTVARRAWKGGEARAWLLAGALLASIAAGVHDLLAIRLSNASGLHNTWLQHAMFAFVPITGWLIAERYSRTAAGFQSLNADLARRVEEREQQLHAAFEILREQQHHQTVSNERQRIMREIHDGVGSQLVALLNMVARPGAQPQALREQVQHALDEMRMAVDSLQPANDDLATVLATLRYRLQPRLEAAGIGVVWDVAELPELRELSPQVVMHVQRILLETFTNVLKHAGATRIVVRARMSEDGTLVTLQIADNGVGFGAASAAAGRRRGGRGLDNMRSRAAAIGAQLHVHAPAEGGVCITLELQVERGESAFSALSQLSS